MYFLFLFDDKVVNGAIYTISKQSASSFLLTVVPTSPGFVSITLSKSITSLSGKTLIDPPILEFNYVGATITSKRVTTSSTSSLTVTVATSKPSMLYAIIASSPMQSTPTAATIISQAHVSSEELSSSHLLFFSDLEGGTQYTIYFAGKEELGTLMDITDQLTATTKSSSAEDWDSKSDGTICPNGWAVSSDSNSLELLPCSYRGYCQQTQCMYSFVGITLKMRG